jgi:antitoxin ParD1/3/4
LTIFANICHYQGSISLRDNIMATMNISLPDPMHDWVQTQIQEGKYSSSSDYVRDLIRRDQEAHQPQRVLQGAITEELKSGISHRSMDDILKEAQVMLNINHLEQLRANIKPSTITLDDIDQAIDNGRP